MLPLFETHLTSLADVNLPSLRAGILELMYHLNLRYALRMLPYAAMALVPLMARMSDPVESIRLLAAKTFASLVAHLPIEPGTPDPAGWHAAFSEKRRTQRAFVEQLLKPESVEPFELPIKIGANSDLIEEGSVILRPYQHDGLSWLAFLNRYGLHGILCDGNVRLPGRILLAIFLCTRHGAG